MKIIKIANEFENEGRDPLENPEAIEYEQTQELHDEQSGKEGNTLTSKIISDITAVFRNRLGSYYVANGSVAWFEYLDDKVYEVLVTPLALGQYKSLLQKNPIQTDPTDNLTM